MVEQDHPSFFDVIIVGAGFAGIYMLYTLRESGFSAAILETGSGIGGTWYWNRYPGARCDVDNMFYSYSFDEKTYRCPATKKARERNRRVKKSILIKKVSRITTTSLFGVCVVRWFYSFIYDS